MARILQNYLKWVDSLTKETRYKVQHKTQQQEAENLAKNVKSTTQGQGYPLFTVYLLKLSISEMFKLRTDYKIISTFVHCAKLICF